MSSRTQQPRSAQPPHTPLKSEALIEAALDAVSDLRERHYEREHEVDKRVLDVVRLVQAAERIGLSSIELSPQVRVLHDGTRAMLVYKNMSSGLLYLDRAITNRKSITRQVLSAADLPLARGREASTEEEVRDAFAALGGSAVVKPITGSGGRDVTTDIQTADEALAAAAPILQSGRSVLVEEMVPAIDLRVCVVAGRAVGATLRVPANVVGDGTSSIAQLVEAKDSVREPNDYARHQRVLLSPDKERFLAARGMSGATVPAAGQRVLLHHVANISAGGDSYEVLDRLHPEVADLAVRAAALFPSSLHAGIDILLERFDAPLSSQRAIVCEVNLNNELPLHLYPLYGPSSPVDDMVVAAHWGTESRIPFTLWSKDAAPEGASFPLAQLTDLVRSAAPAENTQGSNLQSTDQDSEESAYQIDADLLHAALSDAAPAGTSPRLSDKGRFVLLRSGYRVSIAERSGRSLIAGAVGADPNLMHRAARTIGVPVMARHWLSADQRAKAEGLVERRWRTWTLRIPREEGTARSIRIQSLTDLDAARPEIPRTGRARLIETPTTAACVLLMHGPQLLAVQLQVPLTVTGDGHTSTTGLVDRELSMRAANPVLCRYRAALSTEQFITEDDAQSILPDGESLQLGFSPRLADGGATVGLATLPWPILEEYAARFMRAIDNPGIATLGFVPRQRSTSEATWALWRFHSDPSLASFRFPLFGPASDAYPAMAERICSGPSRPI